MGTNSASPPRLPILLSLPLYPLPPDISDQTSPTKRRGMHYAAFLSSFLECTLLAQGLSSYLLYTIFLLGLSI